MLKTENSQELNTFKNKCTRRKRMTMIETEETSLEKSLNFNFLTTTYPLNNSASKKVIDGLYYSKNFKCFKPFIQLLNSHYTHGLKLNSNTWSVIQNRFQDITLYFDNLGNIERNDKIRLNDVDIIFTTSYGTKSVIFDRGFTNQESTKRRKTYTPAVIMQKRTFEGLKRTAVCIDERFHRLERITSLVNQCKDLINDELGKII